MKRTLVFAVLVICQLAIAQEVSMFRGNLQHTGVYNAVGVPTFHRVKWKFQTHGFVVSSPAVARGMAFVGSTDHNLYAVDVDSGAQKWKFETESRVTSSPAVSGGIVYFGSMDGNFYAVSADTGRLKWKFKTAGERRYTATHLHGAMPAAEAMPDPFDFYSSSPAVANGTVYFGSGDGNVYALDTSSGELKWKFKTGDVVHSSPAISGGVLFVGSWDTFLYALDTATGAFKWRFKTGEDQQIFNQTGIQASPAVADGTVYFGCRDSNFYALDANSGKQKWAFSNKGSWVIGSAAIQDGKVYFATSDTGLVRALDTNSGALLFDVNFNHWPMFSSPAIAGKMLYVGSHQGRLLAIDLASQKSAWTFETGAAKKNGPALTDVKGAPDYAAAMKDSFYDDIVAGIQRMFSVGAILSSPAVSADTILVGSADGNLYAIN
jgi:eukaryotic-like serine/threonine-protein kinase